MYHSAELCYLAAVYNNLLLNGREMDFWYKPTPNVLPERTLRVSPDLLPAGAVELVSVEVDGKDHTDFDASALTVRLPEGDERVSVKVRLRPVPKAGAER